MITSRQSQKVMVGTVAVGEYCCFAGRKPTKVTPRRDCPIVIQSMTNTETADVASTVAQILQLVAAGSELVRMTVNNEQAARALPHIREELLGRGCTVPLIGDFHYNGHLLLKRVPECAAALDKYRINPGNVGTQLQFDEMIAVAIKNNKSVRIGGNWGSLDKKLLQQRMDENASAPVKKSDDEVAVAVLVESVILSVIRARELGLGADKIIVSAKTSDVPTMLAANRLLAAGCDAPMHIGMTEAGGGVHGIVSATTALALLLSEGIGDTIRASVTPEKKSDRAGEVEICKEVLQTLGLRSFAPAITSCPGCGRTSSDAYMRLAGEIREYVKKRLPEWAARNEKARDAKIAVMGCVVNGPGESQRADVAISFPGASEEPIAMVYVRGRLHSTLRGVDLFPAFKAILEEYFANL